MFIGLSKTLTRFGKIRIGTGIRLTKNNFIIACFALMFIYIFQATWYLLVVCFWLVYAVFYGMYYLIKKLFSRKKD